MDPGSVAAGRHGRAGRRPSTVLGRDRQDPDRLPRAARWAVGTFTHRDGPGRRARRVRSAPGPAGARGLPDPGRGDRLDHRRPHRSARASLSDTTFIVSFSRAGRPRRPSGTRSGSTRRSPGTVRPLIRRDGPTRYEFAPSAPLQPDVRYRLIVSGVRDTDGLAARRRQRSPSGPSRRPSVVRFRPVRREHGRRPRRRDLGPLHRADGSRSTARAFTVSVGGKAVAGHVRWAEIGHGPGLHAEVARCRTARRSSMKVGAGATNARRRAARGRRSRRPSGPSRRASHRDRHRRRRIRRRIGRRRRRRRWRQLGGRRDLLPGPDELHADRRLGDLDGSLQQPGRPERRAAQARQRDQLARSAGRTPRSSRSATTAATSSVATRATGSAAPATRAIAGPRTSAAARAAPVPPSSARTCSSRARSRTTAATT